MQTPRGALSTSAGTTAESGAPLFHRNRPRATGSEGKAKCRPLAAAGRGPTQPERTKAARRQSARGPQARQRACAPPQPPRPRAGPRATPVSCARGRWRVRGARGAPLSPLSREGGGEDGAGLPPGVPSAQPGSLQAAAVRRPGAGGWASGTALRGGRRRGGERAGGAAAGGVPEAAFLAGRPGAAGPERATPLRAAGRGAARQPGGAVVGCGVGPPGTGVRGGFPAARLPLRWRPADSGRSAAAALGNAARSSPERGLQPGARRCGSARSAGQRRSASREPAARYVPRHSHVSAGARRSSGELGMPEPFTAAFRGARSLFVAMRWEGLIAAVCTRPCRGAEQQCQRALYTLPCNEGVGR